MFSLFFGCMQFWDWHISFYSILPHILLCTTNRGLHSICVQKNLFSCFFCPENIDLIKSLINSWTNIMQHKKKTTAIFECFKTSAFLQYLVLGVLNNFIAKKYRFYLSTKWKNCSRGKLVKRWREQRYRVGKMSAGVHL